MKLLKKRPKKVPPGSTITIHYVPHAFEPVVFPATYTEDGREIKPERIKYCHVVLGYSISKSKPFDPVSYYSEHQLLNLINKEIKNGKKKKPKPA